MHPFAEDSFAFRSRKATGSDAPRKSSGAASSARSSAGAPLATPPRVPVSTAATNRAPGSRAMPVLAGSSAFDSGVGGSAGDSLGGNSQGDMFYSPTRPIMSMLDHTAHMSGCEATGVRYGRSSSSRCGSAADVACASPPLRLRGANGVRPDDHSTGGVARGVPVGESVLASGAQGARAYFAHGYVSPCDFGGGSPATALSTFSRSERSVRRWFQ